MINVFKL